MTTEKGPLFELSQRLFDFLRDQGRRVVLAESCTAGLGAASLAQHPGASDVLCGSSVTYRNDTKHRWLGVDANSLEDPGPVSETVARQMACGALARTPEAHTAAAVTGHLGPNAPQALDGVIFVGTAQRLTDGTVVGSACPYRLTSDTRKSRQEEAALRLLETLLCSAETWRAWTSLQSECCRAVRVQGSRSTEEPTAILSGSFNPFHDGHYQMADAAQTELGKSVSFELSVVNVDKPTLEYEQVINRLIYMPNGSSIWLTRCSTFVEKSEIFPGAIFIVGSDTALRVGDHRYYGTVEARERAIEMMASRGCRFLVLGRKIGPTFRHLDDLDLPASLRTICSGLDRAQFECDISSTTVRGRPSRQQTRQ